MNTQNEQAKWQELGKILGLEMLSAGSTKAVFQVSGKGIHVGYDVDFRDRILNAISAAKQRTPLELAAQEMAQQIKQLLIWAETINSLYPNHQRDGGDVYSDIMLAKALLKKAGVTE